MKTSLRSLVLLVWLTVVGSALATTKPNVLFIIADDLNNYLGSYGDPRAKTPHLDRLAARGLRFDRAYCTFPQCGPSRNSMLTGLYPNSTGILNNGEIFRQTIPKHLSLPHHLRLHGYFTARIGKLYHYGVPRSIGTSGTDDPASWELEVNPAGVDRLEEESRIFTLVPGQFGGTLSWYASPADDRRHTDGMLATEAEWVLERCAREKDRPFFVAVGFFRPHTPFVAPRPYFELYDRAKMPLFPGVETFRNDDLPAAALATARRVEIQMSEDQRRECVQAYYASISFMDAQVGRVIGALDRLGLTDNTIIVFTSDHGYHMGEHGLWQKMTLFEESARVPMLVIAPGVTKAGTVAKSPVSLVDLYPTLAELCGVTPPDNLQGQSLVPFLKDPSFTGRGWALTQVPRAQGEWYGYSMRTARWRYTEWDEGRHGRELYDHETDQHELKNLARDPAHAETVSDLSGQLRAAVKASYPPDGQLPELKPGLWMPNITDP